MSSLAMDLQTTLRQLDADSAVKLERLVRDAIALAQPAQAKPAEVDAKGWPMGYFKLFGSLADKQWDLPDDPPPEPVPK